jgi:hypothetical protein
MGFRGWLGPLINSFTLWQTSKHLISPEWCQIGNKILTSQMRPLRVTLLLLGGGGCRIAEYGIPGEEWSFISGYRYDKCVMMTVYTAGIHVQSNHFWVASFLVSRYKSVYMLKFTALLCPAFYHSIFSPQIAYYVVSVVMKLPMRRIWGTFRAAKPWHNATAQFLVFLELSFSCLKIQMVWYWSFITYALIIVLLHCRKPIWCYNYKTSGCV